MKIAINIICLIICSTILISCFKERIDLDLNNDNNKRVVVTAWLTNEDEQQSILLNYTSDYLDSLSIEYINDADVEISYDDQTVNFSFDKDGVYLLPIDWRGEIGTSYTLKIRHKAVIYEATSELRFMPEVENVYSGYDEEEEGFEDVEETHDLHGIFFSFRELEGEGDGYYGVDFLKGTNGGDTLINGGFIDDEFIDGIYFEDVYLSYRGYEEGDTAVLKTYNIGMDASRYLQDIITETYREGLFDPPPVNVRSNFSNGALGYFIASGVRTTEVIVKY